MNMTDDKTPSDIELLLPWHAAGTLSDSDNERVAEALARDPELARRYAMVRDELGETIVLNETLGAPSARAMNELFAKIDAEPARKPSASLGLTARITGFFANLAPRTLAYASAAAVVAILLQAGFIASVINEKNTSGYVTASAPGAPAAAGSSVLIRFAPQASLGEVNEFLDANKLSIVSGPADGGFFTVKVADKPLAKAELAAITKKLRENKVVGFIATTE